MEVPTTNQSTLSNSQRTQAAQAASSLALLLREDRLLTDHELHVSGKSEEAAFSYAASLLENEGANHQEVTKRATDALAEVHRKLALVESLAERVSRTSPEAVAAPLLRLHGYSLEPSPDDPGNHATSSTNNSSTCTLVTIRERCDRLKRQGEVLEGVACRVESSLQRGLKRMDTATSRLSRVLNLSATLKMILRLQFEASKLKVYDLEDLRDLTRAAASVAVVEDLLSRPELKEGLRVDVVEKLRPEMQKIAASVRRATGALLEKHNRNSATTSDSSAVVQLGATLQVYYHLGELPQAAWNAVDYGLGTAAQVSSDFWSPTTLARLMETATAEAKQSLTGAKRGSGDAALQRALKIKLRELRTQAAYKWTTGLTNSAVQVWNLHRVLCRKSDPVGRRVYLDVVAEAPIPEKFQRARRKNSDFSIFALFWDRLCVVLAMRLKHIIEVDNGKHAKDVSALYPAVRSAAIEMVGNIHDMMQAGIGSVSADDVTSSAAGVLGGSDAVDDAFLGWTTKKNDQSTKGMLATNAESWTRPQNGKSSGLVASGERAYSSSMTVSLSAVFQSAEWTTIEGIESAEGLAPLQKLFLDASLERLCAPLQFMFPQNMSVDENGLATSALPLLPSKYDVQKFDENIRQELSLADPREGGGDFSAVKMLAENIVKLTSRFCAQAQNALTKPDESGCVNTDGSSTSELLHDIKVTKILFTLTMYLRKAPEKTFIEPYRPAVSLQHEDASSICQASLVPAIREIEKTVTNILAPLLRAVNKKIASSIARIHVGIYNESTPTDSEATSFVQKYLSTIFDNIAKGQLAKLPSEYAAMIGSSIATYAVYTFVSNVALVRPMGESGRLKVTQDLADLELILEQFIGSCGGASSSFLSQIDGGKPYAELRAVRQMLFWNGLEDKKKSSAAIAKSLLREPWVKDVRPSTACHFLFSYAPSLLSSPHHAKRMKAEEYVATLVQPDGSCEDGEVSAWMTIMGCCDSYQQRESVERGGLDGDSRVPSLLLVFGQELLRQRRH